MPYVAPDARQRLKAYELVPLPESEGELNYAVTRICDRYLGEDPNYTDIAKIIAALECAKLEFYRRIASPYEDFKCAVNGDVYRWRELP